MINPQKLQSELVAAALPVVGVSESLTGGNAFTIVYSECRIDYSRVLSGPETTLAANTVSSHDPTDTAGIRFANAEAAAANIPNWAGWSQAEWTAYFNANISSTQVTAITSLAEAKVVLGKMSTVIDSLAKMEIALRNRVFPRLEDL